MDIFFLTNHKGTISKLFLYDTGPFPGRTARPMRAGPRPSFPVARRGFLSFSLYKSQLLSERPRWYLLDPKDGNDI